MPQTFLHNPPKNLFFTGKGGVGKTTTSAAAAIALADSGKRVLLVSTDPASNLDEVLGLALSAAPLQVPQVTGLFALNIDPMEAAAAYREKMVGPYRGILPEAALHSMEEQLSGACTVEIAAFNEFATLIGNPASVEDFDHVIFDTAPTGHTLRLLSLPAAWSNFLETSVGGTSCLGPLSGLTAQKELYAATRKALTDPEFTTIVVVSRPDQSSLQEANRASLELAELGVTEQRLVLNGIFEATDTEDPIAVAFASRCRQSLAEIPSHLAALPRTELPLSPGPLLGIEALRTLFSPPASEPYEIPTSSLNIQLPPLDNLIMQLEQEGLGVIMTMGKGGVGKTTIASLIALKLAALGHKVHLTTTDPAAHVEAAACSFRIRGPLTFGRIDPATETVAYAEEVMASVGETLDEEGRALLSEDLRSPCTEEIAVFRAFARTVAQGDDGFVVIDTAPTGHTLLLLDAAEAYHRQVSQTMSSLPKEVRQLLPRLRNPSYTKMLVVTLPEATPVHEALSLQNDLRRAGIEPAGWLINQSLAPLELTDPVLTRRRAQEFRFIDEVAGQGLPTFLVPWQAEPTKN